MEKETHSKKKLIDLLAKHLGVEAEDIVEEDSLAEDLHMRPTDITDFWQELEDNGFETESVSVSEIETVQDLIEALCPEEL